MIRFAAVLGLILANTGSEPASKPPTLDGTIGPEEWAKARTVELIGDGELRFMTIGDMLYVAVTGTGKGLAHVYVASAENISVLHASAALGTAKYQLEEAGWKLTNSFEWKVRDSHRTGPASQEEKDAFFAESKWLANSSAAGAPVREFAVQLHRNQKYLAVAFLALEGMTVSHWPPELSGTGREASFLSGTPPESASFAPRAWHAVR